VNEFLMLIEKSINEKDFEQSSASFISFFKNFETAEGSALSDVYHLLKRWTRECNDDTAFKSFISQLLKLGLENKHTEIYDYLCFVGIIYGLEFGDLSDVNKEFLNLYASYRLETSLDIAAGMLSQEVTHKELASDVQTCLDTNKPYSYVRMGDGEGRYLADFSAYPNLSALTAKIAKRIWFWSSESLPDRAFMEELRNAYFYSDVVGVNPPYRVRMESKHLLVGYCGVVFGNKFVRDKCLNSRFSANWAHSLIPDAAWHQLGQFAKRVFCISCHFGLAAIIKNRFSLHCEVHDINIPPENVKALLGIGVSGKHYPDVYESVIKTIASQVGPGDLVIVAGGVFGKLYSHYAKMAGAVAVDIGSLADQWKGVNTRKVS
jgi:hypothetical protein